MDGIIDIIIGVLFIAIPAIFKAIGSRLEKSGKADRAGKFKKVSEAFEDEQGESTLEGWLLEHMDKEEPAGAVEPEPEHLVVMKQEVPAVDIMDYIDKPETVVKRQKKTILQEEEPKEKGEKIDPKKLVIYSEIMKPKY